MLLDAHVVSGDLLRPVDIVTFSATIADAPHRLLNIKAMPAGAAVIATTRTCLRWMSRIPPTTAVISKTSYQSQNNAVLSGLLQKEVRLPVLHNVEPTM